VSRYKRNVAENLAFGEDEVQSGFHWLSTAGRPAEETLLSAGQCTRRELLAECYAAERRHARCA